MVHYNVQYPLKPSPMAFWLDATDPPLCNSKWTSRLFFYMRLIGILTLSILLLACRVVAQDSQRQPQTPPPQAKAVDDYSGMYTFLREGEFVQVTVEDQGRVTGFVSRYGDLDSDKGAFLDHFFKEGKLEGNKLTFTTETVHGVSFEFKGTVDRGQGKNPGDEAYYVLNGTLVENSTDQNKKTASKSREVALKSFPQEASPVREKRD